MYTVDEKLFKKILKRRFESFVGTSCESIENIIKEDIDKKVIERLIKDAVKKNAYNTMRTIDEQISAFSQGTQINVKLEKPISQ